ncbi:hypothetical protein JTE90_017908 [Oedothorax gibbosus]|uniref:CDT1 Geminin-binding domain-containing protein n=1 Tax=Oedothorax gibbosus TaxID=931172 RepID=A0AAV6VJ15_9ARAC|nr:hypothetical protein JTE90_017908 [Oedothorax gibbosus]
MSQTSVTRHYQFRKRNVQQIDVLKPNLTIVSEDGDNKTATVKGVKNAKMTIPKTAVAENSKSQKSEISKPVNKKKPAPTKKAKKTATDKKSKGKQSTLKGFFASESDLSEVTTAKNIPAKCFSCVSQQRVSSPFTSAETVAISSQQSPKRSPSNLSDEGTPSKKRLLEENVAEVSKDETFDKPKETARRKLQLSSHSSPVSEVPSPKGTNKLVDALIDQSRLKLVPSPKLGELKKALHSFSEKTLKLQQLQSNPYMINCIASSDKTLQKKKKPIPSVLACEKFSHLAETESLVLPLKYKELSDTFRSMDALVAQMYNRKENIKFDAVKEGMQTITKRSFSKAHLGQIVTVFPSAYNFTVDKTSCISKGNNSSEFQLIITPNLITNEGVKGSKKKTVVFHPINPMQLTCRASEFNNKLSDLVKNHHQEFLKKINFNTVSKDTIKRWHPKFPVDSVVDITVAQLPELPQNKMCTAKDVLNKLKGSFRSKDVKPLQSVTEETESSSLKSELVESSKSKSLNSPNLKGICVGLLEKIRGKESALALKNSFETPEEKKEFGMLEKVPKLVNIVYFYFIAERKSAIHIDLVVEKIIHSLSSLLTLEEVKEELKFIQEKFHFWLKFVQCSKGVYITLNKSVRINQMLEDAGLW